MRGTTGGYGLLRRQPLLRPHVDVTLWLDDRYVDSLTGQVLAGRMVDDQDQKPRGTLDLTVTRTAARQVTAAGMRIRVTKGLADADGDVVEWLTMGEWVVEYLEPPADDGTVRIHGRGLEWLLDRARFTAPTSYSGTLRQIVTGLTRGVAPLTIHPDLVDRTIGLVLWERDRIEAWRETIDSWPAVIGGSCDTLLIRPPWPADAAPAETYTTGTIITLDPEPDQAGMPNAVVAQSTQDASLRAVAYLADGPLRWNGPYGQKPAFFSSPLLTTTREARNAARTRLWNAQTRRLRARVDLVLDDRVEVGDTIRIRHDTTDVTCRVLAVEHPVTTDTPVTTVTVLLLSGTVDGTPVDPVPPLWIEVEGEHTPPPSTPPAPETAPPPVTTTGAASLRPTSTGTYRSGWRSDTATLYQGDWTGRGFNEGGAWYGTQLADLPGTLTSATIRLVRAAGGAGSPQAPTMTLLAGVARPGSAPTRLDTAPGPALAPGSATDWQVPSAWLARLDTGEAGGIGCYVTGRSPYLGLTPQSGGLTVTAHWQA